MTHKNISLLIVLLVVLIACNPVDQPTPTGEIVIEGETEVPTDPGETPVPDDTPTQFPPTPMPTRVMTEPLVICLGEEPNTLYPYGDLNAGAKQALQAIYDGPIDMVNYEPQPVILTEIPSFENGLAEIRQVTIEAGDQVMDEDGNPVTLAIGDKIFPTGCRSEDCAVTFDGIPLVMDQLSVQIELLPGLKWSDGEPLTSADSVFGFALASSPDTPGSKYTIQRTEHYIAIDGTTVEWLGIPGFMDPSYQTNFWLPAPLHLWAEMTPASLLVEPFSTQSPTGWGPYLLKSWVVGEQITLDFNPNYHRAGELLPHFPELIFKFVGTDTTANIQLLENGECDVLDTIAMVDVTSEQIAAHWDRDMNPISTYVTPVWEHLAFNITPLSHDDGFNLGAGDAQDVFGDVRFRQAIAMCLNIPGISTDFYYYPGAWIGHIPPDDFVFSSQSHLVYMHDPGTANQLLEEIGWTLRADGSRVAQGIPGVFDYTPLSLTYHTADDAQSFALAQMIAEQLSQCSIDLEIIPIPQSELLAAGPEGPVFGRTFQIAEFAWTSSLTPPCQLFLGEAIPGNDTDIRPYYWTGWNMTGWENSEYDTACEAAMQALPGETGFVENYQEALRILAEELPILPLFNRWEFIFTRPDFCGLDNYTTTAEFWNLEEFGYGEICE